jgi:hypothetical protein
MCLWYTVGGKISDKNLEQWTNIKFCVKIGKSGSETLALFTLAYGEYATKKLSSPERHKRFTEGREDVQDDQEVGSQKCKGQMQTCAEYESWCTNIEDWVSFGSADKVMGI